MLLFVSISIAIRFSSRFFRSINNLIYASTAIGEGNFDAKVPEVKTDAFTFPGRTMVFEGATDDAFETAITVTDPTADRVITIPDAGGDLMLTGGVGQVGNTNIADNTITSAKFNSAVSLILYNSSGVALKTLFGAGV